MSENIHPTMMTYIVETPQQIEYNVSHSKELTYELVELFLKRDYKTIWIIACGSSYNASSCAKAFMMKYLNCDVRMVTPNSFIDYEHHMSVNDFAIVISQSGCSTNSIEALKKLKDLGFPAIGLTGNIDSDFKEIADKVIDYGVGKETVGYVTKGVVTLALFLMLFALEVSFKKGLLVEDDYDMVYRELNDIPSRHHYIQDETNNFYETNKKALTSMSVSYACGFIQGHSIAMEAALKIGETIQIPSFAYEAEEFIHGPNLQLTPNYTLFFIDDFLSGSSRLEQIIQASQTVSDRVFAITNSELIDNKRALRIPFVMDEPLLLPLYTLPFFQIIAYRTTNDLKKWDKHPLFDHFKEYAESKTETISKVMPD